MTPDPAEEQLSERARHLLRVLVESYIREGLPVGSRTLSRDSGLLLSSAGVPAGAAPTAPACSPGVATYFLTARRT